MAQGEETNIFISAALKAYPITTKNHNKVILPSNMLKEIQDKKVFDNRPADKPLIFELSVADPETKDIIAETHVGVEDFTAKPGFIGLPYKTALSLTQDRGIGWLKAHPLVSLSYVDIPSSPESAMSVQPRGKGFFLEDESVVQLDIKTVLERTLKDHLVLTEGDWIPLFWDGNRFELVVKSLKPNEKIDVLNTDLTVEMLPSEETEQSMKEKEEAQEKVSFFLKTREERFNAKSSLIEKYTEPAKTEANAVMFRIKLPKGGSLTKRFMKNANFSLLLDLIEVELFKRKFTPMRLPPQNINYYFNIIYALPGKGKEVLKSDEIHDMSFEKVLEKHDMKGKGFPISLEMIKEIDAEEKAKAEGDDPLDDGDGGFLGNEWLKMAERLETNVQAAENEAILTEE